MKSSRARTAVLLPGSRASAPRRLPGGPAGRRARAADGGSAVAKAGRGPNQPDHRAAGGRNPLEQAVLYAKVAGYLKSIRVDKGDRVHAESCWRELESPELAADLTRQRAEVAVAEVAYRRASEARRKPPIW